MIQLRLFGGASLESGEKPISGRSAQRRRIALLALLALARRGLTRDKLIGFLWAETDMEKARRLLSESLYVLRRELGEDAIAVAGDELRLNPAAIECDVVAFEDAIDRNDPERAATLYAGPFLDGFHISDALELERWIDGERDRLARAYARVVENLAETAAAEGRRDDAVGWWRRLAELDPFNGRFAVGLMQALDAAGNRAAALQHAAIHRILLREELDAEPDTAVAALAERLRDSPDPTWTPRAAQIAPPASSDGAVSPSTGSLPGDTVRAGGPEDGAHRAPAPSPSGSTVTFLFSDIEGSTGLLRRLGPKYGELLATHHAIVRECLARCNGREIDTAGDGFFIAFPRARDAIAAAVAIQKRFAMTDWPDGVTVRVRMGLHTGEPDPNGTGFVGLDVHRAARIASLAKGGRILLSHVTRVLIGGDLPAGAAIRDHGTHTLKDIDEPEHLWEVEVEGASPAPARAALPAEPLHALPDVAVEPAAAVVAYRARADGGKPRQRSRAPRIAVVLLLALVTVGAVGAVLLSGGRPASFLAPDMPDPAGPTLRIVIAPFGCTGCGTDLSYLREGLPNMLFFRLDGVGSIRQTPPAQVNLDAGLAAPQPARLARRFGATHVVVGMITDTGGELTITADIYDGSAGGTATATVLARGSAGDVESIADSLALDLIEALIGGPGQQFAIEGARALKSTDAWRDLVRGEKELAAGRYPQAVDAFEAVVAADASSAHGYYRLSMARQWNLQFVDAHIAAAQAVRHSADLPVRHARPIRAWAALMSGAVEEAERLYLTIREEQPDQVDAWYGLGEAYAHFNAPRGKDVLPAREIFQRVLEFVTPSEPVPGRGPPGYGDARYHLLEFAAADRDREEFERLLAGVDVTNQQRLAFEAVRAFGWGDAAERADIERRLRSELEEMKVGMAAVRVGVHLHEFDGARTIAGMLADKPLASDDWRAGGLLLMAEFAFAGGRLDDARRTVETALRFEPQWPHEIRGFFALPRFVELSREELSRIRDEIYRWSVRDDHPSGRFFFSVHGLVHDLIRLYLLGMLEVRLGNLDRADEFRNELNRSAGVGRDNLSMKQALEASLSANIDLARGRPEIALTRLEQIEISAWMEQVGFSPFYSRAYDRLLMAELNRELNRDDEALRWYRSLTEGYDVLFVAPAHYRIAEIFDRLDQPDSASVHRAEFNRLWEHADSAATAGLLQPRW